MTAALITRSKTILAKARASSGYLARTDTCSPEPDTPSAPGGRHRTGARVVCFYNERGKGYDYTHTSTARNCHTPSRRSTGCRDFIAACRPHCGGHDEAEPHHPPAARLEGRASSGQPQGQVKDIPGRGAGFRDAGRLVRPPDGAAMGALRMMQGKGAMSMRGIARLVGRDLKRVHEDVTDLIELGLLERTRGCGMPVRQDPYRHRNGVRRVVKRWGLPDQRRPRSCNPSSRTGPSLRHEPP